MSRRRMTISMQTVQTNQQRKQDKQLVSAVLSVRHKITINKEMYSVSAALRNVVYRTESALKSPEAQRSEITRLLTPSIMVAKN